MRRIKLIAVLLVAGCAVNPEPFQGPSGKQAYSMDCSRGGLKWADCYKKAGEICPNGYNIIDQSTGDTVFVPVGNSLAAAIRKHLAIECK